MAGVTLKQLRALTVLARERSFARAASRLHLTPPSLTASIKALEEALGLRLFDRTTRKVAPTAHTRRRRAPPSAPLLVPTPCRP